MSIDHCLSEAVKAGELAKRDADQLRQLYDQKRADFAEASPVTAGIMAREALAGEIDAAAALKKHHLALTLQAVQGLKANDAAYAALHHHPDVGKAFIATLEHHGTAPYSSVEGRRKSIITSAHSRLEALLHEFRRGALLGDKGRHNKGRLDNVVLELFGEASGDAEAKALAAAWTETSEWLRQRFNAAGGAIGKLEHWGLPQLHDARALRKAGRETWKNAVRPLLDRDRMINPLTGGRVTAEDLEAILDHTWENVTTNGWMTREPKRQPFGIGAVANQRAEHRVLAFRDAKAWMDYQKAFGTGDPFAAMMHHVNGMARDIAAMEILGPNPSATIQWMKQVIEKEAQQVSIGQPGRIRAKPEKAVSKGRRQAKMLEDMWDAMRGGAETPVSEGWAMGLAVARNWVVSSVLGSAALSSISDVGTQVMARQFVGLSTRTVLPDLVKAFSTASRREATSAGLILEQAQHAFDGHARWLGSLSGPETSRWIADRVLTFSGLTAWTAAGRRSFGLAFMHELANVAGKTLDDMHPALAGTLRRWGFSADDWDRIRATGLHDMKGTAMLRPADVARTDQRLGEKLMEMIEGETEFAVPSGSVRSRVMLVSDNQPGTLWGEVRRSFAMFKSFGAVFAVLNGARIWADIMNGPGNTLTERLMRGDRRLQARGVGYATALLATSTLLGGLAIQLKQISAGRDPRDMTTREFWGSALLQGGGFGIWGDFFLADVNRYGGGFAATLSGPVVERFNDAWNLLGGNLIELAQGKDTHAGREAVNFLRGNVPGGTLWYARAAWEHLALDNLQYLVDPEAKKAFRRKQQWWKTNTGQEFYWKPGRMTPDRMPDFGKAFQ